MGSFLETNPEEVKSCALLEVGCPLRSCVGVGGPEVGTLVRYGKVRYLYYSRLTTPWYGVIKFQLIDKVGTALQVSLASLTYLVGLRKANVLKLFTSPYLRYSRREASITLSTIL
jgi:hypothetical protein